MSHVFLLAWRYISCHRWKTFILVSAITLVGFLPLTVSWLIDEYQRDLMARAENTPLVIGGKGSRFDLALHALYFRARVPDEITVAAADRVRASGLAEPIPLLIQGQARGFPVVGTSLAYFNYRNLRVQAGQQMVRLGDCVLGAAVARSTGLSPGDKLMSDPENVFDIAGAYPVRMRVRGVLAPTGSADDHAVFVDVKTAWLMRGLLHGHQDLSTDGDPSVILARKEGVVVANAALVQYTEVTNENVGSFHLHGDRSGYPLSALIAVPTDLKSETLLLGRYQAKDATEQAIRPVRVVEDLMGLVFRAKRFFDANMALMLVAAVLFLALVVMLSVRLRQREMQMMFKLGCGRAMMVKLQAAELLIILFASAILSMAIARLALYCSPWLTRWLLG